MTARSETLGQDLKSWAAEQLRVELPCTTATLRAAYLRQVQHDNGGPNLTAREALLILLGRHNAARPTLALEAAEDKLQREADDFARRFFSLGIAERRAEWDNLKARGQGFVRVDARLTALKPAIYIVRPHFDPDSPEGQLVAAICELFVLRPTVRAERRQAKLHETKRWGDWQAWVEAASMLRTRHAAIAALEPDLIAQLADCKSMEKKKKQLLVRMRKAAKSDVKQKSGKGWDWRVAVLIFVCLGVLRALVGVSPSESKRPAAQPEPAFNQQQKFDLERIFKNKDFKRDPEAVKKLFGEDAAKQLLTPDDTKPAATPKNKQSPR